MTIHSVYHKEDDDHNPIEQLSPSASAPWWTELGTPLPYGQLKSLALQTPSQVTATKLPTEQGLEKGITAQFTIFPGDCKGPENGKKPPQSQTTFSHESTPPDYEGRFELGFGQPMICPKYSYEDQCYGFFSTYGPQISGRVMLPLNLTTDGGPIFVNAKQYHGIIRRRKSRAKAELEQKLTKSRKPYLHHSRHLHAMRRPRGCGGRFLNTKRSDDGKHGAGSEETSKPHIFLSTGSQNSEVLQSDSSNLTSRREANCGRSSMCGSEVTSVFSIGDLNLFSMNNHRASVLSLSDMMNAGRGTIMPSKWVAAGDSCCNLKA